MSISAKSSRIMKILEKETHGHSFKTYVPLGNLSRDICGEQLLTYFLDGSRHVYKVDDIRFEKSV